MFHLKLALERIFGLVGESRKWQEYNSTTMMRILPPPALIREGKVIINNENILTASTESDIVDFRWKQISIVMQSALNALNPVLSVSEQIYDVLNT